MTEQFDAIRVMARKTALEIVEDVFDNGDISLETTFESLGADSLDHCQIELAVEEAVEKSLLDGGEIDFTIVKTIGDLAARIQAELGGAS